jgi:putative acetyltransferase
MGRRLGETRLIKTNLRISCRLRDNADLADLIALWVLSWRQAMPHIDFEVRRGWFEDHLHSLEAAGSSTIVALSSEIGLLGFVCINPSTHVLDQLAVKPSHWGSGIAQQLLNEARILSPASLILDVNCDNRRAVRFYEREGFQCIGEGINAISGLSTWRMQWDAGSKTEKQAHPS